MIVKCWKQNKLNLIQCSAVELILGKSWKFVHLHIAIWIKYRQDHKAIMAFLFHLRNFHTKNTLTSDIFSLTINFHPFRHHLDLFAINTSACTLPLCLNLFLRLACTRYVCTFVWTSRIKSTVLTVLNS